MNLSRTTKPVSWTICHFDQLGLQQLYALMQLRVDVFVVEQQCVYRELDDLDTLKETLHIVGHPPAQPEVVVACARAMAPSEPGKPAYIGRVVTRADYRGIGLARDMMERLMIASEEAWPDGGLFLSAQVEVVDFYQSLGFRVVSGEYLEDGIAHVDMLKPKTSQAGKTGLTG